MFNFLYGAGSVKKQPVLIEICDDEEISMWYDDNEPLNPSSSGEPGMDSCMLEVLAKFHHIDICLT
jgi:hypothetical protein